jgi:tetratricopeptide (TPR) repeat protein
MKHRLVLATAAIAILAFTQPVFAAGESDSGGANPAALCKKGEVWDANKKQCVKAQSGILPDEELYRQGRFLARSGHYEWALMVLAAISNQNDPRVLNYTGYSHRKAGRIEAGITYYQRALAIDPDFVLAREYLGEGYVAAGRVDLALAQLAEIRRRCGESCEEYRDLDRAIATAVN